MADTEPMSVTKDGIEYATRPGRAHYVHATGCSVRRIGWDHRRGYGPAHVQYRFRCDVHGAEWSGMLDGCQGARVESVEVTVRRG